MLMRFQDCPGRAAASWECRYWQRPHHRRPVRMRPGDQDMPVSQYTTGYGTEQNRRMVEASIKPLAFTNLLPVVNCREYRISPVNRLQHQHPPAYAEKRIDTKADTGCAQQLQAVANIITRPLAKLSATCPTNGEKECKHLQTPFAGWAGSTPDELRFQ